MDARSPLVRKANGVSIQFDKHQEAIRESLPSGDLDESAPPPVPALPVQAPAMHPAQACSSLLPLVLCRSHPQRPPTERHPRKEGRSLWLSTRE
jgi:hypothetical protein